MITTSKRRALCNKKRYKTRRGGSSPKTPSHSPPRTPSHSPPSTPSHSPPSTPSHSSVPAEQITCLNGKTINLFIDSLDKLGIQIGKTITEFTLVSLQQPNNTLVIPMNGCDYPQYLITPQNTFLFKYPGDNYLLSSMTGASGIQNKHKIATIQYIKDSNNGNSNINYGYSLMEVGIDLINIDTISGNAQCFDAPIDLSNPEYLVALNEINQKLQEKCPNLYVEIKPYQDLTSDIVYSFRKATGLAESSILVCLTNMSNKTCVASIEMYKSDDAEKRGTEIRINSYTSKKCRNKQYNKFLRGLAIYFSKWIYPGINTLTSIAVNPLSARTLIETFGSVGYEGDVDTVDIKKKSTKAITQEDVKKHKKGYGIIEFTLLNLSDENREKAKQVSLDIISRATEGFCTC